MIQNLPSFELLNKNPKCERQFARRFVAAKIRIMVNYLIIKLLSFIQSKNYSSPTSVTKLKVADLTRMKKKISRFNNHLFVSEKKNSSSICLKRLGCLTLETRFNFALIRRSHVFCKRFVFLPSLVFQ